MKAYWVIDILKDIRQFSEKNGMIELAEQLDDAIFVAASEIGVKLATADVARASDVPITMLPDTYDVELVLAGEAGVIEGVAPG